MNTLNLLGILALITLAFVLAGLGYSNGRRQAQRMHKRNKKR